MPDQDTARTTPPVRRADLRDALGPDCHRPSMTRTFAGLIRDLALYGGAVVGIVLVDAPLLRLGLGVAAGLAVAAMFVWAHDAAHGALFHGKRTAELLGTLMMLPSLQMYRLWQIGHNRVHHGFTALTSIDWIWRPWSPAEYAAASALARFGYRIERSAIGCGWHYLRRVWWDGMVRFRPTVPQQRRDAWRARAVTALWVAGASGAAWLAGGWWAVVAAVAVPWLVFTYVIAATTYLHHTHPSRRFFRDRATWTPLAGQVTGSIVIRTPKPLDWFLHHIFIHTPHHLDSRIPYYRLPTAWRQLRPAVAGLDVLEYRLRLRAALGVFASCKLYDYETDRWHRFTRSPAPSALPAG